MQPGNRLCAVSCGEKESLEGWQMPSLTGQQNDSCQPWVDIQPTSVPSQHTHTHTHTHCKRLFQAVPTSSAPTQKDPALTVGVCLFKPLPWIACVCVCKCVLRWGKKAVFERVCMFVQFVTKKKGSVRLWVPAWEGVKHWHAPEWQMRKKNVEQRRLSKRDRCVCSCARVCESVCTWPWVKLNFIENLFLQNVILQCTKWAEVMFYAQAWAEKLIEQHFQSKTYWRPV